MKVVIIDPFCGTIKPFTLVILMTIPSLKTRFCPSPTGLIHLGNARTALFNCLLALNRQGTFLLRVEDTDTERSTQAFDEAMQRDLHWLGLDWQEGPARDGSNGPYYQSKRQSIYDGFYECLQTSDRAYPCFCTEEQLALARKIQRASGKPPRYAGTCSALSDAQIQEKVAQGSKSTLRFRVPDEEVVEFDDIVRGKQRFQGRDIGDFIIRRTNGTSPFMFCNAIDDALMGVTHVLRGEDHLTNTPRQLMILNALELKVPTYGHIALIVAPDGSPLSKRHGSRSIEELQQSGYLPLAIINYMARLGHYYDNDAFMSLAELASHFKFASLNKSPAKFNLKQLNYWQKQAVEGLSEEALLAWLGDDLVAQIPLDKRALFVEAVKPNIQFPEEVLQWRDVCFKATLTIDDAQKAVLREAGENYFNEAVQAFEQYGAEIKPIMAHLKTTLGIKGKALYQPLRIALTGVEHGPELAKLVLLIAPEHIKQRLEAAKK